jgi:hypothetical protein
MKPKIKPRHVTGIFWVFPALLLAFTQLSRGANSYFVNYQAIFDSGFGSLPRVELFGNYTFEALPATYYGDNGTSAYFYNHIQSASFVVNGSAVSGLPIYMRVDNNIPYGPAFRDLYLGFISLNTAFEQNFVLTGAGLDFELVNAQPNAFTSLALPTSTADLAGFLNPENRQAVLTFQNLTDGIYYATYAPVEFVSITPVPEPSVVGIISVVGSGVMTWRRRQKEA